LRLVVLGLAIAAHAALSQLLYAGVVDVGVPAADRRAGATLMYYGGDAAELLLAFALVTNWRPRHRTATPSAASNRHTAFMAKKFGHPERARDAVGSRGRQASTGLVPE
jgi:putative membrane protein